MTGATDDDVTVLLAAGLDRAAARTGAGLPHPAPRSHRNGGPMEPLAQFDQLGPVLGGVIAGISPGQLDLPTPCADFTVRGILEHMIGGATAFGALYRGEAPTEPAFDDPIAGIQVALGGLAEAISAPGALDRTIESPMGALDGATFARFVVLDGLVHGWDMANATGQVYDPPAELVDAAGAFARTTLDPLRDGTTFAAAVEPPAGATPMDALAAYTGRRPVGSTG